MVLQHSHMNHLKHPRSLFRTFSSPFTARPLCTTLGAASVCFAQLSGAAVVIGPVNGDFEDITASFQPANWFTGQNATGFVNAIGGTGFAGSGGVGFGANDTSGTADLRSQGFAIPGSTPTVDLSFDYRFLPGSDGGPPAPTGSLRLDLRFWDGENGSGAFLGESNVFLTVDGENTSLDFTSFSQTGIAVPANALSADLRLTANIFTSGYQGWSNFDNFSVSVIPEPGVLGLLGLGALTLLRRRRSSH